VRVDDEQVRQVFFNLLINSCEAMADGGRIEVTIDQPDDATVTISLCDEGPGIQTDEVGRLFEPFFTTKDGGTGLGLAIANKIITAHDGSIRFRNRDGGGAEFIITIPVGRVEQPNARSDAKRRATDPSEMTASVTS
jgi:signal transduction histidine kinase